MVTNRDGIHTVNKLADTDTDTDTPRYYYYLRARKKDTILHLPNITDTTLPNSSESVRGGSIANRDARARQSTRVRVLSDAALPFYLFTALPTSFFALLLSQARVKSSLSLSYMRKLCTIVHARAKRIGRHETCGARFARAFFTSISIYFLLLSGLWVILCRIANFSTGRCSKLVPCIVSALGM